MNTSVAINVLANDTDPNNYSLTITGVGSPSEGTAAISGSQIVYTPSNGYTGADSFAYTISDGNGGSASATVSIEINNVTNLIQDGGFESPAVGSGSYTSFVARPSGTAWSFSASSGVSGNGSAFTAGNPSAPEGTQVAFLQNTASIFQIVNVSAGTYAISFESAQRGNYQASTQTFQVVVDGITVGVFTPAGTGYTSYETAGITLSAGSHTILLQGTDPNGGDNTAFIDNVQLTTAQPGFSGIGNLLPSNVIEVNGAMIPNFGATPTVTAVQSGSWSDRNTWSTGQVPGAGAVVSIGAGMTVTYDVVSTANVVTVAIQAGGTLQFSTSINTELTVINLLVMPGGTLTVGTESNPVSANVAAQIVFPNVAINTAQDPSQYGDGLIGLGNVVMSGAPLNETWVSLAAAAHAGDTTLQLAQAISGWQVGNKLYLPDTSQLTSADVESNSQAFNPQWETPTVSSVSGNGLTITLSAPLQYDHLGWNGATEFLPHVSDLSRNVVVHSQSASGTRGHVLFMDRANVDIRYVQFTGLGRTQISAIDNTTYDANGNVTHIGTNQDGLFPVYFSSVYGPSTTPQDGYQFTFVGNSIFCPLTPMPFKWGLAIASSSYGFIQNNVIENWAGAGMVFPTGSESYNLVNQNFVGRIGGSGSRSDDGTDGFGFWFVGPNNYVTNNVATDIYGYGPYEYGFAYTHFGLADNVSNVSVPAFPGADAGNATTINVDAIPVLAFSNNEVYGATYGGLDIWWIESQGNGSGGIIENFTVWNLYDYGIYLYPNNNLTIDGYIARGGPISNPSNWAQFGIYTGDYGAGNLTISNANIQGFQTGFDVPAVGSGTTTVKNSYFGNNSLDISVPTVDNIYNSPQLFSVLIKNDTFVASGDVPISTVFTGPGAGGAAPNYVAPHPVYLCGVNGNSSNNYQVWPSQASANNLVPLSCASNPGDSAGDGFPYHCTPGDQGDSQLGVPVIPGVTEDANSDPVLTNAQAMAQYGVAVWGGAPDTAVDCSNFGLASPGNALCQPYSNCPR